MKAGRRFGLRRIACRLDSGQGNVRGGDRPVSTRLHRGRQRTRVFGTAAGRSARGRDDREGAACASVVAARRRSRRFADRGGAGRVRLGVVVDRRVDLRSGVDLARVRRGRPAQVPGAADTGGCSCESSSRRRRGRPRRRQWAGSGRVPARDRHARVSRRSRRPPRPRAVLRRRDSREPADVVFRGEVVRLDARRDRDRRGADRRRRGSGDRLRA